MTHKEARQRIVNGEDVEKVKNQFIQGKLKTINYDKIAYADIRLKIEPKYMSMIFELDFCYYIFWRFGESCPFQQWDRESFETFTKLSNEIYDKMTEAIMTENEKVGKKYPQLAIIKEEEQLDKARDLLGVNFA
uniref:Uncharacterized protein n=1 Tax=viral metagenome TaxID=1070528 RepID=A0A6M3K5J3_9ZZZZ